MRGHSDTALIGLKLVIFFMILFGGIWWAMSSAIGAWHS
jgi:hypothetical protein